MEKVPEKETPVEKAERQIRISAKTVPAVSGFFMDIKWSEECFKLILENCEDSINSAIANGILLGVLLAHTNDHEYIIEDLKNQKKLFAPIKPV